MIHGRNLIISIDGTPIAGAKTCNLKLSQDFLQYCSPTESRVLGKLPTTYDWGMSVSGLIPSSTQTVNLADKLVAGTRVLLTFTDGSGQNRAGFAYVKSCEESGSVGSLATFSASFESDGALYKFTSYNATKAQESTGFELGIVNNTLHFEYDQQSQSKLYLVEVSPNRSGTIIIYANDIWAVLGNMSGSDVEALLDRQDSQSLETDTTKFGNSPSTYTLDYQEQLCTIVCNDKPQIIFIYE